MLDAADTVTATLQLRDGTSLPTITLKAAGQPQWPDNPAKLTPFILSAPVDISTIAQVTVTLGTTKADSSLVLQDFTVVASNDGGLASPIGLFEATLVRSASGLRNTTGLNNPGKAVLREIMRHGMFIDIDHMSDLSKQDAIEAATQVPGGYPLNSGHSGLRGFFPFPLYKKSLRCKREIDFFIAISGDCQTARHGWPGYRKLGCLAARRDV